MKSVLVSGAGTPLGQRMLQRLAEQDGVEYVLGLEPTASSHWVEGAELVAFPTDQRELVSMLADYPIDTVIHCNLAPDRSGSASLPSEAQVVDTMQLGAALASPAVSVRSWVIASSSGVYPVDSHRPLLHRESGEVDTSENTPAASIREAEDYARDVAARCPHLNVALMRLQHVVGEGIRGPMMSLVEQPVMPRVIGYNAALQLLAIGDAVRALLFAAELELAGVYNVASVGTIRQSEMIEALGKPWIPVLPLEAGGTLGGLAHRFGVPHVPEGMLPALRFGHALDIGKLAAAGFEPECDQIACLEPFRGPRGA